MEFTGLIYMYGLVCLSMIGSIIIAGFSIAPAFAYFERKGNSETARRKSLAVAISIWILLQTFSCLIILLFIQGFLI